MEACQSIYSGHGASDDCCVCNFLTLGDSSLKAVGYYCSKIFNKPRFNLRNVYDSIEL